MYVPVFVPACVPPLPPDLAHVDPLGGPFPSQRLSALLLLTVLPLGLSPNYGEQNRRYGGKKTVRRVPRNVCFLGTRGMKTVQIVKTTMAAEEKFCGFGRRTISRTEVENERSARSFPA